MDALNKILAVFSSYDVSVLGFISALLQTPVHTNQLIRLNFLSDLESMMDVLYDHPASRHAVQTWLQNLMTTIYSNQLLQLNEEEKASAITAKHFTKTDIQNFNIESLALKMDMTMPDLCALLEILFNADQQLNKRNQLNAICRRKQEQNTADGDVIMMGVDSEEDCICKLTTIRVVHSSHFSLIFCSFSTSFLNHF